MNQWSVQQREDGTWVTRTETSRFIVAVKSYDALTGDKRLLLNGRSLRIRTIDTELDLYEESA